MLALTACATCYSQSRSWRLLPDSMVLAPFKDVHRAAVFRLAADMRNTKAVLEISARMREADALYLALEKMRESAKADSTAIADLSDMNKRLAERGDRWARKARRRGVTVGVLSGATAGLALAALMDGETPLGVLAPVGVAIISVAILTK